MRFRLVGATAALVGKYRAAAEAAVDAIHADHETLTRFQAKYGSSNAARDEGALAPPRKAGPLEERATTWARANLHGPLGRDLVEKIGFQLIAAYRVMRFLREVEAKLPARVASRAIRHLYGSDVHWDAEIAPGVMIVHGMGMAISHSARIGHDVLIFQNCTLGEGRHPDTQEVGAPTIEDGAVIGAGATILGPITIGARSKIMPGCVVVRSVPPDSIVESPQANVRARRAQSRDGRVA